MLIIALARRRPVLTDSVCLPFADGGPGAEFASVGCPIGSDCADCGSRRAFPPPPAPPQSSSLPPPPSPPFSPPSPPSALLGLGGTHSCAYLPASTLLQCWGSNSASQLGDGTTTSRSSPTTINSGGAVVRILALGDAHTCAYGSVQARSALKCWGRNNRGQLGDGTNTTRNTPTTIKLGGAVEMLALGDDPVAGNCVSD